MALHTHKSCVRFLSRREPSAMIRLSAENLIQRAELPLQSWSRCSSSPFAALQRLFKLISEKHRALLYEWLSLKALSPGSRWRCEGAALSAAAAPGSFICSPNTRCGGERLGNNVHCSAPWTDAMLSVRLTAWSGLWHHIEPDGNLEI